MSSGRHRRPARMTSVLTAGGTVAGVIALTTVAPATAYASIPPHDSVLPRAVADTVRARIITRPAEITVKAGDSLSKIAGALCGNPRDWTGIFAANRKKISDPDLIYPSERLVVSCKSVPLPAVTTDAVTVRHKHYYAGSEVVGTSGMGSFQSCVISRESSGNARAVNPSSGAGGLYQFLPSTWHSLGYSGLPEDAPVAEQNTAFQKAYAESGVSPWRPYDGC